MRDIWNVWSVLEPLLCWLYSNGSSMLMPSPERVFHHGSRDGRKKRVRPSSSSSLPSSIYKPDGVCSRGQAEPHQKKCREQKEKRSERFVSLQCAYESPHLLAHFFSLHLRPESVSSSYFFSLSLFFFSPTIPFWFCLDLLPVQIEVED